MDDYKNDWMEPAPSEPPPPAPEPVRRRRQRKGRRVVSLVLSAALFGSVAAGSFCGVQQLLGGEGSAETAAAEAGTLTMLSSTSGTTARYGMDVSDIAAMALPCVVSITNISVQEVQSFFHRFGPNGSGQTQLEETVSCGSGVIIYSDEEADALYIVTNQHVVADAMTLSVSFVDNSVYEAQLCGTDEELDLAVLKVALTDLSEQTLEQIDVISIGDSDALEVGEQVVAIGNALGYSQSVTTGIVSALNRSITNEDGLLYSDRCGHQSRKQRRCAAESGWGTHRDQYGQALLHGCGRHGICHPHLRCHGTNCRIDDADHCAFPACCPVRFQRQNAGRTERVTAGVSPSSPARRKAAKRYTAGFHQPRDPLGSGAGVFLTVKKLFGLG